MNGEQFLEFIGSLPRTERGCTLWTGRKWGDGYPLVCVDGKWQRGNRAALSSYLERPLERKYFACHHCDNPLCLNPDHLFEGTDQDNKDDMVKKGRAASGLRHGLNVHPDKRSVGDRNGLRKHPERAANGERNGNTRYTRAQIQEVVRLLAEGVSDKVLMKQFQISASVMNRIIRGIHWGTK